ncbi:alkylated DNA repair protein alkB-like protein [Achlya hypogyna]|uniref:Alkylated DNA repair protein alkB-like protein n=1 Tax=Achlya hypogyna TaxID=1202772 RepID=A0A1V9ZA89_ACHHY|nr:alkylated DNA repair protein alkB-like protein [Achlya hypogyna]
MADLFRATEKQYRARGNDHKNARQRRRDALLQNDRVDYSNVMDVHVIDANLPANASRIRQLPVSSSTNYSILDPSAAQLYEIDGLDGLQVITNAMPVATQVAWAFRAVRDYSQQPYNNVTNLSGDRGATQSLWTDAWHEATRGSMKEFHALRWANIGAHYDWTAREYVDDPLIPALPAELKQLVHEVYAMTGLTDGKMAESAIVNFYPAGTCMGGHLDNAEEDMMTPIVSLSLGTQCIYLQGGLTKSDAPTALWLRSGDIIVMGGKSRRCFHGVPLVTSELPTAFADCTQDLKTHFSDAEVDAFAAYMAHARVNINLRRVGSM